MRVALVQMEIRERNCAGNTQHGLALLEEAAKQSDLVILPEIWTTGYSLGHLKEEAVTLDGPLVETLRGIARKYQCSLLPGSLPVLKNGLVYNMIPAINKEGTIVHQYGKAHLFGMFDEEKFFAPGNAFDVFDLDGVCCGSTICYDLRFPEFYRYLALQGAQLIVCPAVNCVGAFKGDPFYGHSRVIDPMNHIIAEGGSGEEIIYAEIDLEMVAKVRRTLNALEDIRFTIQKPGENK